MDSSADKKSLGTKTPVSRLESVLKIGFKISNIDQPNLLDLETFQFAASQQSAQVLQVVAAKLGSNINGYVVVDHDSRNLGVKWNHPDLTLDAGQFLQLAPLIEAQHFQELLNTHLVWFGMFLY